MKIVPHVMTYKKQFCIQPMASVLFSVLPLYLGMYRIQRGKKSLIIAVTLSVPARSTRARLLRACGHQSDLPVLSVILETLLFCHVLSILHPLLALRTLPNRSGPVAWCTLARNKAWPLCLLFQFVLVIFFWNCYLGRREEKCYLGTWNML